VEFNVPINILEFGDESSQSITYTGTDNHWIQEFSADNRTRTT